MSPAVDMEKRVESTYKDTFWFTLRKTEVSENKGRCLQTVYRDEQCYAGCGKRRKQVRPAGKGGGGGGGG
jgi:hypothetical protein